MNIRTAILASTLSGASLHASPSTHNPSGSHETRQHVGYTVSTLLMMEGSNIGNQTSILADIPLGNTILHAYLAAGEDPRLLGHHDTHVVDATHEDDHASSAPTSKALADDTHESVHDPVASADNTDFVIGGISLRHDESEVGARALTLDNDTFIEMYAKYASQFPDLMRGADAWIRVGVTLPEGVNLSAGSHINITDDDALSLSASYQTPANHNDEQGGSLIHARLDHHITEGVTCYAGVEYRTGQDHGSFPHANILDSHSPSFVRFAVPGDGVNFVAGTEWHMTPHTSLDIESIYNLRHSYFEFIGQVKMDLGNAARLSGGLLIDTRPGHKPVGFVGITYDL